MTFKFVHTADLHLDSPLRALALRNKDLAQSLGTATRRALSNIVDLCLEERVDALLIAGDLWDGKHSSTKTPRFLKAELNRLDAAGIQVFIIRGNHDAESKLSAELDAPPNTIVFGAQKRSHPLRKGDMEVVLHGVSMPTPHVSETLLPLYPAPQAGAVNIGLMHTSLNGSPDHDRYAPCALSDLDAFGYDYWALGHIHKRALYQGASTIVMAGTPQGRDIGEAGETSVTLVTLSPDGSLQHEARTVAPLRFERLTISIEGISDWSELIAHMGRAIAQAAAQWNDSEALVLRPRLTGRSDLAWRIGRDRDLLTEEANVIAEAHEGLWIDKLELQLDLSLETAPIGLPPEIFDMLQGDLSQNPALLQAIEECTQELIGQLPSDLRHLLGDDPQTVAQAQRALLARGTDDLLLSLSVSEEE